MVLANDAFRFLQDLPSRPKKPREQGITMMIDWGIGLRHQQDYLDLAGEYIDLAKIAVGISGILRRDYLTKKIRMYHDYNVITFPGGGFLELAYQQGQTTPYLQAVVELGYQAVEVSDNYIDLPANEKMEIISRAQNEYGLRVLGEVGKKEETSDPREMIADVHNCLKAGAWKVFVEARELFQEGFKEDLALELSASVPIEKLIFETPSTWAPEVHHYDQHQTWRWLIDHFGSNVNIANVDLPLLIELEVMRQNVGTELR
jgi:phosphosulfolactate synthase